MYEIDFMCSHCGDEHQIPVPDCTGCAVKGEQLMCLHRDRLEMKAEIARLEARVRELEAPTTQTQFSEDEGT